MVMPVSYGGGQTPGPAGDMYFEQDFTTPASTWNAVHGLGRVPGVSVYDDDGNRIGADIQADSVSVTVIWPGPTTGKVVCS